MSGCVVIGAWPSGNGCVAELVMGVWSSGNGRVAE